MAPADLKAAGIKECWRRAEIDAGEVEMKCIEWE